VTLLVVCGEPSGDRAAAKVLARVGVPAFGMAGPECERAGLEPCVPAERSAAMGVLDVAFRARRLASAMLSLRRAVVRRRPRVALLVNFTEFNARLLGLLRRQGVRVVWYAAPQVWAWRASRARPLARAIDAMAVVLPFEEALWRGYGVTTRYVGHPTLEEARLGRAEARARLGIAESEREAVAVLPGSRPAEVRRLLPEMLASLGERARSARVLLTTSLDATTRGWAEGEARASGVAVHPVSAGASEVLAGFDVALCASGTASLESALAGVPPVVAYRLDPVAAAVARALLRTEHVALPNVLLGRRAFAELLQADATAPRMRHATDDVLSDPDRAHQACTEVCDVVGSGHAPSQAVADMLTPWL
jgi:lipid-A-disaccharide synthase